VTQDTKPLNDQRVRVGSVMRLNRGGIRLASGAYFRANDLSTANGVAKDSPRALRSGPGMFLPQCQPKSPEFCVGLSRVSAPILPKCRIRPQTNPIPFSLGGISTLEICGSPRGRISESLLSVCGVVGFPMSLRFFGIGVGHDQIIRIAGSTVKDGWTP